MDKELFVRYSPDRWVELARLPSGQWSAMTAGPHDRTAPAIGPDPVEALLKLCDLLCAEIDDCPGCPGPGYAGWAEPGDGQ